MVLVVVLLVVVVEVVVVMVVRGLVAPPGTTSLIYCFLVHSDQTRGETILASTELLLESSAPIHRFPELTFETCSSIVLTRPLTAR